MTNNSRSTSSQPTLPPINRYGTMAWDHWERQRPHELANIPDPVSHFRDLGRLIDTEIDAATIDRLGPSTAASTERLAEIRCEVEEEVLAAHLWLPAGTGNSSSTSDRQDLDEDLIDQLPVPFDSPMLAAWQTSPLLQSPTP